MAAPANTTAALAVELGPLPNSIPQRVDSAGTSYTVWYRYTAQPGDTVVGIWAFGDLVTYTPTLTVFSPDSLTQYLNIAAVNVPVQFPVTAGQVYYLRIAPNGGNPSPANLVISGLPAPNIVTPRGSFLIPDDTDGFAASLLHPMTGAVLRFLPAFPAGEDASMLPSGILLCRGNGSIGGNGFFIFPVTLTNPIGPLTISFANAFLVSNDGNATFYIGAAATNQSSVSTFSSVTGVQGPTTWTPTIPVGTTLTGIAPNPAGTILYYYFSGSTGTVRRWDLVNNVALSDLAAAVAGYSVGTFGSTTSNALMVLSDGTILVPYFKSTTDTLIKHYSAAGAVLNTYNFTILLNSMCRNYDDPTSFIAWLFNGGTASGKSVFRRIKVSDGTVLVDTGDVVEYEFGIYLPTAVSQAPTRFGHSQSCPIVTLALDPANPCAG